MEQINIQIPEGHEIDLEKSNLAEGKIIFKRKEQIPWRKTEHTISGFYIADNSDIRSLGHVVNNSVNRNIFTTAKHAKSMLAMAQLSQIIANDKRFGGPVTDKEWKSTNKTKYVIIRYTDFVTVGTATFSWHFLAFHKETQRELFLEENRDLIKQYYMLD